MPATSLISSAPAWSELSAEQKTALAPLAAQWNSLEEPRKRKWIEMSRNYAQLPPAEQAKMHSRMTEWANLSQAERTRARLNFGEAKHLPAEERKAKWDAYQSLPPEEKARLAAGAPVKPIGAAPAVKPVPQEKLVVKPKSAPQADAQAARATPDAQKLDRNTLLPQKQRGAWSQGDTVPPVPANRN